jgi:hypothetical protein
LRWSQYAKQGESQGECRKQVSTAKIRGTLVNRCAATDGGGHSQLL